MHCRIPGPRPGGGGVEGSGGGGVSRPTPRGGRGPAPRGAGDPPRWLLLRVVRILLECILVFKIITQIQI